jgi:hypothetical protein
MTQEGDLVLVYMEDKPAFFARIEAIMPDPKPNWFQVKMLVLQLPLLVITWILREPYINGEEFTMGGQPVRMVRVVSPEEEQGGSVLEETAVEHGVAPVEPGESKKGKVVSLADRRKKDHSPS